MEEYLFSKFDDSKLHSCENRICLSFKPVFDTSQGMEIIPSFSSRFNDLSLMPRDGSGLYWLVLTSIPKKKDWLNWRRENFEYLSTLEFYNKSRFQLSLIPDNLSEKSVELSVIDLFNLFGIKFKTNGCPEGERNSSETNLAGIMISKPLTESATNYIGKFNYCSLAFLISFISKN